MTASLPTHPRRTGFLSSGRDSYGVRRSLESLFRGFGHEDVQPVIICLQDGEMMDFAVANGIEALLCPIGTPSNFGSVKGAIDNFQFMLRASRQLAGVLRESRIDSMIVRQPYQVPLAARAAYLAKVPSYWLMPNLVSDTYPMRLNAWVYDLMLAHYGMVAIGNSAFTRNTLINRFARSAVSHLGIDPAEFDPKVTPAERAHYGFAASDALFGIFARVVDFKGQRVFVEAMAQLIAGQPDLRLLICGGPLDTSYAESLRADIVRHGLEGKVVLSGPSDRLPDSLPSLYAMCDVIVNARIDPEPFGLSIIEGMLMAKPLLVHALGGPAETVVDGEDGWHVTDPTPAGFALGLSRAMADRDRWPAMGKVAEAHARSSFTHVQAARRIISIIANGKAEM